jgi:hypothetical protein
LWIVSKAQDIACTHMTRGTFKHWIYPPTCGGKAGSDRCLFAVAPHNLCPQLKRIWPNNEFVENRLITLRIVV